MPNPEQSDQSDDDESISEEKQSEQSNANDFSEVKLSTRHAAFLRKIKDEWYLQYSTQN